ncbi:MAG: aminotransferase class III-fold pyridoxal phosphate-dependent enzyme [Anaerolineae bacterium]|nr:aminotransferase class III-fold pyridoxal phosphate-dependent enzyme [Anaerolineae bacterium]
MSPRPVDDTHVFKRRMWHDYPRIVRAEGIYLIAEDGRRFIDAAGGAVVVNVGHGVTEIAEAMAQQARQVGYVHAEKFTTPVMEEYAAALAEVIPMPDPKFFPLSTGSEANEAAIKLARQIQLMRGQPLRHLTIGRWNSYHGITLGTLAVGGRKAAREKFLPMMRHVPHIEPPACYRCPFGQTYPDCGLTCARDLERTITQYEPDHITAFIAEPVSGASLAATTAPKEYWPMVRDICNKYGVLLIADEVMCGFGRTGKWCAFEHFGFTPDILTIGKGLAGGIFPLSLMVVRGSLVQELYDGGQDIAHGGTFSHHPVGAAAGLATLRYMQQRDLVGEAARKGAQLGQFMHTALDHLPGVGNVRGIGMMWGVEFVQDPVSKEPFAPAMNIANRVFEAAQARGLVLYPGRGAADGMAGDTVMVAPPTIINEAEMQIVVETLAAAIQEVCASLVSQEA